MAYDNGMQNAASASQLPYLVKSGLVPKTERQRIDDALPNNWPMFTDNAAGTGKIPYINPADANNQMQLMNPNGVGVLALQVIQLATPGTPTITTGGTAGVTTVGYKIVAKSGRGVTLGSTAASAEGTVATANATLSATNFAIVTFNSVPNAVSYDIYRTTAAGTPSSTGLIGSVSATFASKDGSQPATYVFNDTGLVADGTTAPSANTTGSVAIPILAADIKVPVVGTPVNVVATPQGTAGSTTISYKVVARGQIGTSAASSIATTTTANATLSATNNVLVTWDPVPDAVSYDVYRTAAGGTPNSTGLIKNVTSPTVSLTDTGLAGDSSTPPTVNTTGALSLARILDTASNAEIILTATGSAVNQLTVANAATGNGPSITASGSDTNIPLTVAAKGTGAIGVGQATSTGIKFLGDQPIQDSAGNPQISFTKTASAVNGIGFTNSATGNGTNNAVVIAPVGTDAAIAVTLQPTGAAGQLNLGLSTGTGTITVGSSSGAQTVAVAAGAGAPTVTVANASTAGASVTVAGAATAGAATDTINVATGNAAATGFKKVNILTGTPGTNGNNQLMIGGSVASAAATMRAAWTYYQDGNLQLTETGVNNAIAAALTDAAGSNIPLAAGLIITVKLAHSLQAGANTFNLNGGGAVNLKSSRNPANNIATAYVSTGFITMLYDGTQWLDCSQ